MPRVAERPEAPAGAIDRALAVLGVLAESSQPMGVTEIARRVGLPKSVVHYHVSVLARNHYVEARPDRRYGLGYAALRLGRGAMSNLELRGRALPHMRELHHDTWETVTLSVVVGRERVYVDQLVSPQEIKLTVELGRPLPLHAGAPGHVILAFLPDDIREGVLAGPLERITERTMVDPAGLRAVLERVRATGLAASHSERQTGGASVAAPVFDSNGIAGAMSICGPEYRFDAVSLARFGPLLQETAARLSRELGWR